MAPHIPEAAIMERLRLERGFFRNPEGEPVYLLGANYWPQLHGPWMYRDEWNGAAIAAEFEQLAALGCNVVRVFCFTPDFLPTPHLVNPDAVDRLESLVALAAEQNLWSIPTFLVGHMSGENWQPQWSVGLNWFSDETVLSACELLIATIAQRFASDARIAGWLITNEWPLFAGEAAHHEAQSWAQRLTAAVRAADPSAAVSLGDGAWDVIGGEYGTLPAPALTDIVDFFGPHFYPKETDALRHSVFAAFAMRMTQTFSKPALLEEFGCSSDQASDEFAADYYRTVLWSGFGAGNCGTLFWNSHDFPLADRSPYSHHPYELHFGIIRTDGSLKPQAAEVRRFANFVSRHDVDAWQPEVPRAAIGRCGYYFERFPFDWGWSKLQLRDLYLQTYACASVSGVDAAFVDLSGKIPGNIKLLYVPCLQQVTTQDAAQLESFVRSGGALYLSYGGEPWFPRLGEFIGAQPQIRYGLVESSPPETRLSGQLTLRFVSDFATISKGSVIQVTWPSHDRHAAPLLCEPGDASVLAVDESGAPALFLRQLGQGHVIFMAYPLEYLALHGLDTNARNGTWKLYHALAEKFEARAPVRASRPGVQSFSWHGTNRQRLLLINHSWEEVATGVIGTPEEVRDAESGENVAASSIVLPKKGVRCIEF